MTCQIGTGMSSSEGISESLGLSVGNSVPGEPGKVRLKTFDWSKNKFETKKPIIIAGGLNCDNVEDAIKVFLPYGVAVSYTHLRAHET